MSSCYSGDRIARDHMHTDIITCKMEEPKQKLRLEGVINRVINYGVGLTLVLIDPNVAL